MTIDAVTTQQSSRQLRDLGEQLTGSKMAGVAGTDAAEAAIRGIEESFPDPTVCVDRARGNKHIVTSFTAPCLCKEARYNHWRRTDTPERPRNDHG